MQPKDSKAEENKLAEGEKGLRLTHSHNYMSPFKKSKKFREDSNEEIIMMQPGQARSVIVKPKLRDLRAGVFPQHNSPGSFNKNIDALEAIGFKEYQRYFDIRELEKAGWQSKTVALTRKKLAVIEERFANLSLDAFQQMMGIQSANKRDFELYYLKDPKQGLTKIAYAHEDTGLTQFIQMIYRDNNARVIRLVHCMFDHGMPFVINEARVDSLNNVRQISHVGEKGNSTVKNALERFDDATVTWTVTKGDNSSGTAALTSRGEIVVLGGDMTEASMLAARNLGAEGLKNGVWDGCFSLAACLTNDHPMQREYKDAVRKQVNQIIDGASIPGLRPIFDL